MIAVTRETVERLAPFGADDLGALSDEGASRPRRTLGTECTRCRERMIGLPVDLELDDRLALWRDVQLPYCTRCGEFRFPPQRLPDEAFSGLASVSLFPTGAIERRGPAGRGTIAVSSDFGVAERPRLVVPDLPAELDLGDGSVRLGPEGMRAGEAALRTLATGPRRLTGMTPSSEYGVASHPRTLKIETTTYCNVRCVFCTNPKLTRRQHLSLGAFRDLWSRVDPSQLVKVGFTGLGETLLNREFWAMHAHVKRYGLRTSLVSNGMLLDRHAAALVESGLDDLAVSIETADAARYEGQRRGASLARVLAGIERVLDEKSRRGAALDVHVLSVMVGASAQEQEALVRICFDMGLDPPRFYPPYLRFLADEPQAAIDVAALERRHRRIERAVERTYGTPCATAPREVQLVRHASRQPRASYESLRCREPASVFVARANGSWTFCNEGIFEPPGGDLIAAHGSVAELWTSSTYRRFRLGVATAAFPAMCDGCHAAELPAMLAAPSG